MALSQSRYQGRLQKLAVNHPAPYQYIKKLYDLENKFWGLNFIVNKVKSRR